MIGGQEQREGSAPGDELQESSPVAPNGDADEENDRREDRRIFGSDREAVEARAELGDDARHLEAVVFEHRDVKRPPREFVGRDEVGIDRDDQKSQNRVSGKDQAGSARVPHPKQWSHVSHMVRDAFRYLNHPSTFRFTDSIGWTSVSMSKAQSQPPAFRIMK